MAAKVFRIDDHKADTGKDPSVQEGAATDAPGWDPYEVWRTRILLPRMRDGGEDRKSETAGSQKDIATPPRRPKPL